MYKKEQVKEICDEKIVEAMGKEYVHKHNGHICIAEGELDNDIYVYFAGFDDENKENEEFKGWTVYANFRVDLKSGKIIYEKIGKPKQ